MAIGPGTRVGPYEVTTLLGEGGMGKVWRARHTALKREDALQVLSDVFTADPERLARVQREAEVLASLRHPNIAQVPRLEEAGGSKALVMEMVEGPTLVVWRHAICVTLPLFDSRRWRVRAGRASHRSRRKLTRVPLLEM